MTSTESFIDGAAVASADYYDNLDPATGRSIGAVARGALDAVTATKTVIVAL